MDTLKAYARTWNRDNDANFAVACYDQQSLAELEEAAGADADTTDMETWGIESTQEWHDAISAALWERMQPRIAAVQALLEERGLADAYGERGGLIAEYEPGRGLLIRDEASTEVFPSDVDDETITAYLQTFLDDRTA